MEDFLQVGVITATHGIRGEVKVFPTTDDPERFLDLETVYLDTGREKKLLTISSVKFFKQFVILKFKEFDNINDVEPFRKKCLLVTRDQAVPLEEDEYFIAISSASGLSPWRTRCSESLLMSWKPGPTMSIRSQTKTERRSSFRPSKTVFFPWTLKKAR